MPTGKHGSAEITISCDDAPGGTLRAITPYVTQIGGVKITALTQAITAFGDTWVKNSPTGLKKVEPIQISGFFDDTATVGPHVVFISPDVTIYDGTTATSRTLTIVFGNSKTFTVECLLTDYAVMGKNGNLTEYQATLTPTSTGTWS